MNYDHIDMEESLRRYGSRVLYDGPEGRVVRRGVNEGYILSDIADGARLCQLIDQQGWQAIDGFCLKDPAAAAYVQRVRQLPQLSVCGQWVYTDDRPPVIPPSDIRPFPAEWVSRAAEIYRHDVSYLEHLRQIGHLWAAIDEGQMAGFIGLHDEGGMGLLEILPSFRRRGWGWRMESFLIAYHRERGWVPYCHVRTDNVASVALQHKLGLQLTDAPSIWVQ